MDPILIPPGVTVERVIVFTAIYVLAAIGAWNLVKLVFRTMKK